MSRLVNRNVMTTNGRTSIRLEPELWDALREVCQREDMPMADLIRHIDSKRTSGGRTSAVRVFVMQYFRDASRGMKL